MKTTIVCQRCNQNVSVPGTRHEWRCDSCNVLYWGYHQVLDLPVEDDLKRDILHAKDKLSHEESEWLVSTHNHTDIPQPDHEEDLTVLIGSETAQEEPKEELSIPEAEEIGWLIMKTEGREEDDFPLMFGKNYIGRPFQGYLPSVPIVDDIYVSRFHALLNVCKTTDESLQLTLSDNNENVPETEAHNALPSTNGCYLNGQEERLSSEEKWPLSDGDTIQIGETKLVLKLKALTPKLDRARTEVLNQDFEKTVLIPAKRSMPEHMNQHGFPSGWIVSKNETGDVRAYVLKPGENRIGRKFGDNELEIGLIGDKYISRFHARIIVKEEPLEEPVFTLFDDSDNPSGKPSSSGTYVNGDPNRLSHDQHQLLAHKDLIKLGKTALMLITRTEAQSEEEAINMATSPNKSFENNTP